MSGLTARNFGLHGRGSLQVGNQADVVIFDADTVADAATYESPITPARGIDAVIVNGAVTWRDGVHTGGRNGQVITRADRKRRPVDPG